jgi:hypothetical protein
MHRLLCRQLCGQTFANRILLFKLLFCTWARIFNLKSFGPRSGAQEAAVERRRKKKRAGKGRRKRGKHTLARTRAMTVGSLSVRSPPAEKVDQWPATAAADLEGLDEARCQLDGTRWGTHPHEQAGEKVRNGTTEFMPNQVLLMSRGAISLLFSVSPGTVC